MAPKHRNAPPRKPLPAAASSSSSSSEEDTSSGGQEVEQHPTKNPPTPPPAGHESDGDDEKDDGDEVQSSDEIGEHGVLTKHLPPPPQGREGSDDEEESESDEASPDYVFQPKANVPPPKVAKSPPPKGAAPELAMAHQESEVESSDEVGDNGVPAKRLSTPPLPTKGGQGSDDEEEDSDSDESSPLKPVPQPKENAPSPDLAETSPLKRKAAATELAKSPLPKKKASPPPQGNAAATVAELATSPSPKKALTAAPTEVATSPSPKKAAVAAATEVATSPPPKKAAAVAPTEASKSLEATAPSGAEEDHVQEVEYNAEKHLEEKSESYFYLWQVVKALEADNPGLFNGAFLKVDDAKASKLNTKIKKHVMADVNLQSKWWTIEKEVTKELISLIK